MSEEFGDALSMPTFRKYVQFGLVDHSARTGTGGPQGSKGVYPHRAVTQLVRARNLARQGMTMRDIGSHAPHMVAKHCESVQTATEKLLAAVKSGDIKAGSAAKGRCLMRMAKARIDVVNSAMQDIHSAVAAET